MRIDVPAIAAFVVYLLVLAFFASMLTGCGNTVYIVDDVMSGDVVCRHRTYFQASVELYGCENGKHYFNPVSWKEVQR